MRTILSVFFAAVLAAMVSNTATAQGCVAIKGSGATCMLTHADSSHKSGWVLNTSARYFKSFRHFSGTEENKARLAQGTEVINHTAIVDLALTRILNDRWSIMVDVPIVSNARSSLYEHGLVNGAYVKMERHSMHSFGLGDVRVAAFRWMIDPAAHTKANVQLGLGIKLATGDYNYKDYWYNVGPNGTKELRPVDQSIQLGDGGTGFTVEANTYYNMAKHFGLYGNFYYLVNPREQNGTRTYRETLSPALANEAIMSVPDQYMARAGFAYTSHQLTVSAGARIEGIPVHDLIGGSGDFRRPGYILSAEPAVNYTIGRVNLYAAVPVAIERNRLQSVTDKENTAKTGKFTRGDAAFADYTINIGAAFRL